MKLPLLFLLSLILSWITAFGAERGIKRIEIKTVSGDTVGLYEESHALVVGVSNYTKGWPKLPGVKDDIGAVREVLEEHGFGVEVVENPKNRIELEQAFNSFIQTYGRKPDNRLLFYFAGHGHTIKNLGEEMGYIVPAGSPNPNRDQDRFLDSAMDMQMIEVYAKRIRSKHALFVFDSCFSGSLFALSRAIPQNISYKTASPVRQFITSGTADETVPDQSIFRRQFTSALQGEGDTDQDGYVTALELGEFLQKTVVNYSKNAQHPQYGKIRNPNLDKGDFVFVLPKAPLDSVAISIPALAAPPETSGLQLKELTKQAKGQEQAKAKLKVVKKKWSTWQTRMQKDFNAAKIFESRDITPDLKIEPWRQFLEAYASNNPFGKKDENLRFKAKRQLEYWRSENVRLSKKNIAQNTSTASVDISNTPEISAPPTNPDADKIWKKYQLGLKRNLPKLAEKYLQELLTDHPESSYAIKIRVEELNAQLDKNGLRGGLIDKIEEIRAKHPRNPDLRKLIVQARPFLLRGIDRFIEGGSLDFAEQALSFAARWNVPGTELSRLRQQIKQVRISSLIKDADLRIKQGNAKNAEQKLTAAMRLGADPAKIEELRREIPLKLVKYLIETDKFEKAGEQLLELELGGEYNEELPELYKLLLNKKNQFRWDKILALIKQKKFSSAEVKIIEWEKNDDAPKNLPKLKAYLQQEETEFNQHIKKRRERVGSLIRNNKFSEAKRELSQWENTGEDRKEWLKQTTYYLQNSKENVFSDRSTGLMWQKKTDGVKRTWKYGKRYCQNLVFSGYSDWRLPNIKDLQHMFKKSHSFRMNYSAVYWSSSSSSVLNKWYMHLGSGNSGVSAHSRNYDILCVRGGN